MFWPKPKMNLEELINDTPEKDAFLFDYPYRQRWGRLMQIHEKTAWMLRSLLE